MKPFFFDTETTGLNPKKHSIYDTGIIYRRSNLVIPVEYKIRPIEEKEIDPKAIEMSGKSIEELNSYPSSFSQYLKILTLLDSLVNKFDKKDNLNMIGYNVNFDFAFLRQFFIDHGNKYFYSYFNPKPLCVMQMVKSYFKDKEEKPDNYKLITVCKFMEIEVDETKTHTALYDTWQCYFLYNKLKQLTTVR